MTLLALRARRARVIAAASATFIVVSLAWLTVTLSSQARSVLRDRLDERKRVDATFVYNGYDRVFGAATQGLLNAQGAAVLKPPTTARRHERRSRSHRRVRCACSCTTIRSPVFASASSCSDRSCSAFPR